MKRSRVRATTTRERASLVGLLRDYTPWIILAIVVVLFSNLSPGFLTATNLLSVLNAASIGGLVAIGETLIIIAGGFDLSVAAIMLVGGMTFAVLFINLNLPTGVAMLATLATTVGLGLLNGLVVTKVKLPAFIATLATMFVFTGLASALGGGGAIYNIRDPIFSFLGQGKLGEVPMPAFIFIVVAIIAHLLVTTSRFGRTVYAVGSNEKAARMSGINVDRTRLMTYMISGFLCGLAALILTSRLEVSFVVQGEVGGYAVTLLDAISAVMIGGISIFGGEGRMYGLIGGILLIQVLTNGMATMGLATVYHMLAKGALILIAVSMDVYFRSGVSLRRR